MRYENRTFKNETITLDDNQFIDCAFENCTILYSGGDFTIEPLKAEGFELQFMGPARNAVELFQFLLNHQLDASNPGTVIHIGGKWFRQVEKPKGIPD